MFEHDFFISYSHLDDESLIAGEQGWISELHRLLGEQHLLQSVRA